MAVAVDKMGNRLVGHFGYFGLQPCGCLGIDWIAYNNPIIGDHKHRIVKVVLETPDISLDINDLAFCILCKCRHGDSRAKDRNGKYHLEHEFSPKIAPVRD